MKKLGLFFLLSLLTLTAVAQSSVEIDGVWYILDAESNSATVTPSPSMPNYAGEVIIPESITYDGADYNVTAIAPKAFAGCSEIISVIIGNNVTTIGESAFSYSTLISVSIGDGVTTIGNYAFYKCAYLVDASIGNGVTTIGTSAFHGCSELPSVIIGSSVASIGESAFYDCSSLNHVYFLAEELPSTMPTSFDSRYQPSIILHVPAVAYENYSNTLPWRNFGAIDNLDDGEIVKCEKPVVGYSDGHLVFTCATESVSYRSFMRVPLDRLYDTEEITSPETFTVYVFAYKRGCYRSDTAISQFKFSGFSPVGSTPVIPYKKGDLNHDGKVNAADHVELTDIIMNQE